ncbi:MAG: DUF6430 domain-containing protein [Coriobacteriia bacterium]|nr:DUF6430 domain-containing protein [Coriobacteriia bacterium]
MKLNWDSARYWVSRYLVVLGAISLVVELTALFVDAVGKLGALGLAGVQALTLVVTMAVFWPRRRVSVVLGGSHTRVSVVVSDILKATGSIVVGSNDAFDTELGEVVRPESLQGQVLVGAFNGDQAALDVAIEVSLRDVPGHVDAAKSFGKGLRYPIGTVAVVRQGEQRFFLLAFCTMLEQKRVSTNVFELWESLRACWTAVRDSGQHSELHVPVLGTKFGRTGLPWNLAIQMIVMSFVLSLQEGQTAPSLTVHIHPDDVDKVDFIGLASWLKSLSA